MNGPLTAHDYKRARHLEPGDRFYPPYAGHEGPGPHTVRHLHLARAAWARIVETTEGDMIPIGHKDTLIKLERKEAK